MRFYIQREVLLKPLQLVAGAVEKKQNMPQLASIRLQVLAAEGQLALSATDLEMEWVAKVALPEGTAWSAGEVIVPARKWMDICRALPEGAQMEMRQEGNKVLVLSNRSRYSLIALPLEGFPSFSEEQAGVHFQVSGELLGLLLEQVSFAMAQQDVRYYFNGVSFVFSAEEICAVATDGHRLALMKVPASLPLEHPQALILPRKAVPEIARLVADAAGGIAVDLSPHLLRLSSGQYSFRTKLIEGKFPNYGQVLPHKTACVALINREAFKEALMRAAVLFSDRFRGAGFFFRENTLTIRVSNQDRDEAEIELEMHYEGAEMEVGFNISYLLEYVTILKTPFIKISFNNADTGVLFEAEDGSPGGGRPSASTVTSRSGGYIVMPVRL